FYDELLKTNHRVFTTAYMLADNSETVNYADSQSSGSRQFIANVIEKGNGEYFTVTMRNRFKKGDKLEVLSPDENFNKTFIVDKVTDEEGNLVEDAKLVQQKLRIYSDLKLNVGDIIRR
ncbi:MAG: U32 family peptidase C-terminal domain-containing protein, partial [Clostridia bacterium]|nr:U32 family peptidase C-terminal domain-containing protein [Clostridia bacterium]